VRSTGLTGVSAGPVHILGTLEKKALCLAFDRLLEFLFVCFFSFSFLFCYFHVGVVNALIKAEIEDHVWFEDRWMVAPFCDE
jgi:hypothetical protein